MQRITVVFLFLYICNKCRLRSNQIENWKCVFSSSSVYGTFQSKTLSQLCVVLKFHLNVVVNIWRLGQYICVCDYKWQTTILCTTLRRHASSLQFNGSFPASILSACVILAKATTASANPFAPRRSPPISVTENVRRQEFGFLCMQLKLVCYVAFDEKSLHIRFCRVFDSTTYV